MNNLELLAPFLNSSFFTTLVTLLVGVFAIRLYLRQRADYKSDAAKLILQEIRYAEEVFRSATKAGNINFPLYEKMLPTNNWNKNIHLFIFDLGETELDLISRLYSTSSYIDHLVTKISDFRTNATELSPTQQQTAPQKFILNQDTQINSINNLQLIEVVPFTSTAEIPTQNILKIVCNEMEPVYNTPTGEKLKHLSTKRPLFLKFL